MQNKYYINKSNNQTNEIVFKFLCQTKSLFYLLKKDLDNKINEFKEKIQTMFFLEIGIFSINIDINFYGNEFPFRYINK